MERHAPSGMPLATGCRPGARAAGSARGNRRRRARSRPADPWTGRRRSARRIGEMLIPRDDAAGGVERRTQPVDAAGPVEVLPQVFLAGPDHLHRPPDRLRHRGRFRRIVGEQPPAEAAARAREMDPHGRAVQPRHPRDQSLDAAGVLHRPPDFGPVRPHVGEAVHRLHRHMRQERHLVRRLEHSCGAGERRGDVAVVPDRLAGPLDRREHARCEAPRSRWPRGPAAAPSGPRARADPAWPPRSTRPRPPRLAGGGADSAAARCGRPAAPRAPAPRAPCRVRRAGGQTAGAARRRRASRGAARPCRTAPPGHDVLVLHPGHPRADEPVAGGVLARRLGGHRPARGVRRQRAVFEPPSRGRVEHGAGGRVAFRRRDAPARSRGAPSAARERPLPPAAALPSCR